MGGASIKMDNVQTIGANRSEALDTARGLALIAMMVFHFTWDLEYFGLVPSGFTSQTEWKYFARAIAASFLFLSGMSLVFAHGNDLRWRSFWRRFVKIAAAALVISMATVIAMPQAPVYFGILHAIAACSLIGTLVMNWSALMLVLISIGLYFAPGYLRADIFNDPWFWWLGLSTAPPRSFDYVPLVPWLSAFLAGMAFIKLARAEKFRLNLANDIQEPVQGLPNLLAMLGRKSLLVYLIHQPILMGILWLYVTII